MFIDFVLLSEFLDERLKSFDTSRFTHRLLAALPNVRTGACLTVGWDLFG